MELAILGAGPTGLEAALAAAERGIRAAVYEAGPSVAAHVRAWGHVRVFTPWDMNVSPRAHAALGGRAPTGQELPTGDELARRLYEPLGEHLAPMLRLGARVTAVGRDRLLKHDEIGTGRRAERRFRLLVEQDGAETVEHADAVLDCTGTYGVPNAIGNGGIPAPGERATAAAGLVDRGLAALGPAYAGRRVLLTGAGHSAQTAARDLAALARHAPGMAVVWAVRAPDPDFGAVPDDPLPARRALTDAATALARGASPAVRLARGTVVEALAPSERGVRVTLRNGDTEELEVDRVLALNGGVGDFTLYRQLQVHECYATAGPMALAATLLAAGGGDCLAQPAAGADALRTPEPGFFILGAKSYGRTSQFLLRVGWQQVDDVMGMLCP